MPDMIKIVAKHPRQVQIHWKKKTYRLRNCGCCRKQYWHVTSGTVNTAYRTYNRVFLTYCSTRCRLKNWKVLNAARQRRWKQKRKAVRAIDIQRKKR